MFSTEILIGKFEGTTKGVFPNITTHYFLDLKSNNTFNFRVKGHDYAPECFGMWQLKGDSLILICDNESDISILLSSGYMNQRKFKFKVKSKRKLTIDRVVLNRK
jgi:hypothetical protein